MKRDRNSWIVLFVTLVVVPCAIAQVQKTEKKRENTQEQVVVFVCEHGAAKSIVAAAYFNKLAAERNLRLRAIARGTSPQEELSASATKGLKTDGLASREQKPTGLTKDDISGAIRIVAFCKLPEDYYKAARVEEWNDVPVVGEGYDKARDIIVEHIKRLLDELE